MDKLAKLLNEYERERQWLPKDFEEDWLYAGPFSLIAANNHIQLILFFNVASFFYFANLKKI